MSPARLKLQLLIWSGPVSILVALFGWVVFCGFLPPPSPDMTASQVQQLWAEHTNLKMLGLTLCFWAGPLYIAFAVAIAATLWRDEIRPHVLSLGQAALATFGAIFLTVNFLVLMVVAFRVDRDPESMRALHDLGFLMTVMPAAPFTFAYILIAIAILASPAAEPAFPRWVGYFNLWVAVLFLPAAAVPFFKDGPLAWNGLLGFWIPGGTFVAWIGVMAWAMHRALPPVARETLTEQAEPLTTPHPLPT